MRLRRKRFHATVTVQAGDWPILLGFGPAINLEATADEARALAVSLCDAIEAAQRQPGGAT